MGLSLLLPPAVEPVTVAHLKSHMRIEHEAEDGLIAALLMAEREYFEDVGDRAIIAQTLTTTFDYWSREMRLPRPPLLGVISITYRDAENTVQTLTADQYLVEASSPRVQARICSAYGVVWPSLYHVRNAITVKYVAGCAVPVSVVAGTNVFTSRGLTMVDGEAITFSMVAEDTAQLPAPLSAARLYYVRDAAASTFKVSETLAGTAVDITGETTNQLFVGHIPEGIRHYFKIMVANKYENREATSERALTLVPLAAESLFYAHRSLEAV